MDARVLGLLILVGWGTCAIAFFYAKERRTPYFAALLRCSAWAAAIVLFVLFNYWLADLLEISKGASGYVRGRNVLSPYGFLVQLLLIVEVGTLIVVKRHVKSFKRVLLEQPIAPAPEPSSAKEATSPFPRPLAPAQSIGRAPPLQLDRTFSINGATVFLLFCSAGNFWLGAKALQHSAYGLFYVLVAIGLLVAAFNVSVKQHVRKE